MATIYKGNKPLLGGGVGEVNKANSATNANTASNSLALGGILPNRILEKWETAYTVLKAPGWYRIGRTKGKNLSSAKGGILILERQYNYQYSEIYIFAISVAYDGNYDITQLSGCRHANVLSQRLKKIRILWKNDDYAYIDVYYDTYDDNTVYVTGIGGLVISDKFIASEIPSGYKSTAEFETAVGFKALRTN